MSNKGDKDIKTGGYVPPKPPKKPNVTEHGAIPQPPPAKPPKDRKG